MKKTKQKTSWGFWNLKHKPFIPEESKCEIQFFGKAS